ncbi:MAG: DUF523 domain-containing protein [Candidatus Omnitrophica bacterium]|nr:DUF523 domain-containing protein [Candidatus Omnitrophota bacterium]
MILASACLAGEKCRYNGEHRMHPVIAELGKRGKIAAVCPEVMGGLSIPRLACEIEGADAQSVLDSKARVLNMAGGDITEAVLRGCYKALDAAKKNNIKLAVLKDKSVCCAVDTLYDGSFQSRLVKGKGILALLLEHNGIRVVNSEELLAWPI